MRSATPPIATTPSATIPSATIPRARGRDRLTKLLVLLAGVTFVLGCPGFGSLDSGLDVSEDDPLCVSVQTILDARCARCHGATPSNGAPEGIRLDVFEDTADALGAATMAFSIVDVADIGLMPPAGSPEGRVPASEVALLRRWADGGAPYEECRGGSLPTVDVGLDGGADASGADADAGATDVERDWPFTPDEPPTAEDVYDLVLVRRCAPHHVDGARLPYLGRDGLAARLQSPSIQQPELDWIEPGHPDESYLYLKVIGGHRGAGGTGSQMPIGPALDEDEVALIRLWIEEGRDL